MRVASPCWYAGGIPFDIHKKHSLEAKLTNCVRSYLAVRGQENEIEQKHLRSVCSMISAIVALLLRENEAWNPYDSVDGISPSATEALAPGHLKINGLLIWWGNHGKEWWEPFSGTLRISDTSGELLGYQFMFGDAAWGLGKVPYNEHPRGWNWSPPEKWIFTFTKP